MKDGGQICLDWLDVTVVDDQPIVIILPGLTGSSQSEYVKSFVLAVQETGARCAVFNNRGLGGVQLKPGRIVQPTVMTWKKPLNTYARSTLRLHSWLLASLSEA
ncbi:hypothetical protein OTU49_009894 [Cherax quadricarinatus]|uniref:Uncharacterized protein n=1 Tax=Cherax quadricarinatus TaxID=27406 RepID=A0AAW0YJ88_CHEQU